jgi:hypothetical protein
MKLTLGLVAVLIAASLCPRLACAAGARQSVGLNPGGGSVPVTIEASVIEQAGKFLRAHGNVLVHSGDRRMTAGEVHFDWDTGRAELKHAMFTTCSAKNPDYRIEAASATLIPPNKLRARNMALFLGKTRILMLPSVKMRIGGRRAATDIFPKPSYDENAGVALAQKILLIDSDRVFGTAELRVSAKNGFEGDFEGAFAFDGVLTPAPVQPLTYPAFRTSGLAMPVPVHPSTASYDAEPANPARLRGFARISSHLRTYNAHDSDLLVYREPELGLAYTARPISPGQFSLDPRLPISPVASVSLGRFSEVQGAGPLNRRGMDLVLPVNVASIDETTVIQPVLQFSQSSYETGATYTYAAAALGVSHLRSDGTLEALRVIKRGQRGTTPFQFDQLYVLNEVQAAVQFQRKRDTLALVAGYDLGNRNLYDWSALVAHSTDCLAFSLAWSNLERKVLLGVHILSR